MTEFVLHPDFEPGSVAVGDLPLCHVRLQHDQRWPWLILSPRRPGLIDLDDLSREDRMALMDEQIQAAAAVRTLGEALLQPVIKLNVAALGNVTPQFHVHVIGRRRDDAAWPAPVWGVGVAEPYSDASLALALATVRAALRV